MMGSTCISALKVISLPDPDEDVSESIFQQYERVIVESIVTSFGLDFLLLSKHDQYGGDVDTIHNVRMIGKDPNMNYKNAANAAAYENRGEYNSASYHSDPRYKQKNKEISQQKKDGTLVDAYTGEKIARNGKTDLDHVISAKEIHDDRGRVLAGLRGEDLANADENLCATNPHTNRTKKADSMEEFHEKRGREYTPEQLQQMKKIDAASRKSYEAKLRTAYYTSPAFMKATASAAGKVGIRMGTRQAFGFVFMEIWFSVKQKFAEAKEKKDFDLKTFFYAVKDGITNGIQSVKSKYKELLQKIGSGVVSGALASITTTLTNIFVTTAKNTVKIIRESWTSLVDAVKILLINPDNLLFGERFRAATKVIATGASVVVGQLVNEMVSKSPLASIPVVGPIIQTFCGVLTTGIMSCSLLYFLDHSKLMNCLIEKLNKIPSVEGVLLSVKEQGARLEQYAAELMQIDLAQFRKETSVYEKITKQIELTNDETELNEVLLAAYEEFGFSLPWKGNFDEFMGNRQNYLVFR